jgi:hypothetical protein
MTQLVGLTIGIPVIGAIAGSMSLAGLHRGIGTDVALNAVFAAAIWAGLRPRGRRVDAVQAAADAVSAAPAAGVRSTDSGRG